MRSFVLILLCLGAALAGVKAFDYYLITTVQPGTPDEDTDQPTMRTADYLPYTGGHMQAYKRERGKEVLWNHTYDDYDVRSGEYGFFIDFALEKPPIKAPHEIRIVLTGGSAAQGWGARTNEDMFYKLLPTRLNSDLKAEGKDCTVSVINLAMGSTVIYQNFIALNKWAHDLKPDAIVTFAGHNELAVVWSTKTDQDVGAPNAASIQYVLRYSSSPAWLKTLAQYFPGIVRRTQFGALVRFLYLPKYVADWQAAYAVNRLFPHAGPISQEEIQEQHKKIVALPFMEIVERVSVPMYVHTLESIARDFPKIPIFAVFQPLYGEPVEYTALRQKVTAGVSADEAANIKFYDMQADWQKNNFYPGSLVDPVHLSNEGHKLVTDYLERMLAPFVSERCSKITSQ